MGAFKSVDGVSVATLAQMLVNLRHVLSYGAGLVGFTYGFDAGRVPTVLQDVHVLGALLIVACSAAAIAKLVRGVVRGRREASVSQQETERWWLDDVLVIAMFGSAATFVVLAVSGVPGARYLVATVVFASVLSGRIVAQAWQRLRPGRMTRAICVAGGAVSLCFAAGLGCTLAQPVAAQSASTLASFLEAHHLRNGVGGYWAASITTVESKGAITVRPVLCEPRGKARPVHEAVLCQLVRRSAVPVSRLRDAYLPRRRQCLGDQDLGPSGAHLRRGWLPRPRVVQHLQRRTVSTAAGSGSAGGRFVRHMIVSHAQTTALPSRDRRSSRRGKAMVFVSPLRAAEWASARASSVGAFQVETDVRLLTRARRKSRRDNRSAVRVGRQDLLVPVPVASPYPRGHSRRGLILHSGGTTPIQLRGGPHALLPFDAGARLVVRTLATGRVGRRRDPSRRQWRWS